MLKFLNFKSNTSSLRLTFYPTKTPTYITGKGLMVDVNMRNCTKEKGRECRQVPKD